MRTTPAWIAVLPMVAAVCLLCAPVCADNSLPDDLRTHKGKIHRPQDTAPDEQIIIPRPAVECRPEGSLLSKAYHNPAKVDTDELHRRKKQFYAGSKINQSLTRPEGYTLMAAPRRNTAAPREMDSHLGYAEATFWALVAACALATAWLLAKSFISWRRQAA